MFAYAARPVRSAVEVGAGTGKATRWTRAVDLVPGGVIALFGR